MTATPRTTTGPSRRHLLTLGGAGLVAAAFVKQWMNSEGHRANILNGAYNRTGVGIAVSGDRIYATQDFGQY